MSEPGNSYCAGCGSKLRSSSSFCSTCALPIPGATPTPPLGTHTTTSAAVTAVIPAWTSPAPPPSAVYAPVVAAPFPTQAPVTYQPHTQYSPRPVASSNGLAISAMVCGIAGLFSCAFTSILAIIFGHIALHQINRSGGIQSGRGMAISGLILGYGVIAFGVGLYVFLIVLGTSSNY